MSSWAVTSHAYATHTLARSPIVYYGSPFQAAADGGFRPGMPRLRDLKNNWTLTDFLEMDERFVFKIKKQEEEMCTSVTLDSAAVQGFMVSSPLCSLSRERGKQVAPRG